MKQSASEQSIRVLLADDHTMFREGLRRILGTEPDIVVVGEARTGQEAVKQVTALMPDVVLMDIRMPGIDGVQATRSIRQAHPGIQVIVLTAYRQDSLALRAMAAGARGYILKDAPSDELIDTIRKVNRGEALLDSTALRQVLDEFRRLSTHPPAAPLTALTPRQLEILRLVARGASNREIADDLSLAEKTVKNNLSIIFRKLEVGNRTEAAIYAIREGLVSLYNAQSD